MKTSKRQKQVKELVTQFPILLQNYSSSTLVSYYWKYIENAKTVDHIAYCSSPEAITRAFRRLVTSGEITLSKESKERNQQNQKSFKEDYSACWTLKKDHSKKVK